MLYQILTLISGTTSNLSTGSCPGPTAHLNPKTFDVLLFRSSVGPGIDSWTQIRNLPELKQVRLMVSWIYWRFNSVSLHKSSSIILTRLAEFKKKFFVNTCRNINSRVTSHRYPKRDRFNHVKMKISITLLTCKLQVKRIKQCGAQRRGFLTMHWSLSGFL